MEPGMKIPVFIVYMTRVQVPMWQLLPIFITVMSLVGTSEAAQTRLRNDPLDVCILLSERALLVFLAHFNTSPRHVVSHSEPRLLSRVRSWLHADATVAHGNPTQARKEA